MSITIHFWEIKDKSNFPLIVFSTSDLSNMAVIGRAQANNLIGFENVQVRVMDVNEIKMYSQFTYAYSLDPHAVTLQELSKKL